MVHVTFTLRWGGEIVREYEMERVTLRPTMEEGKNERTLEENRRGGGGEDLTVKINER